MIRLRLATTTQPPAGRTPRHRAPAASRPATAVLAGIPQDNAETRPAPMSLGPVHAARHAARRHAVILALAAACTQAAEVPSLGRLFNTPQQRAQLDAQRMGGQAPAAAETGQPAPAPAPPPAPAPAPPPPQVLNGVVKPAGGKATVWLNQEPLPVERRTMGRNGQITVVLPSGRRITLKPGQRYDETTGEVRDDVE